ncbi:type II secretion system F family protein [Glaciecola petra]|uniref:Type II secretion system F family protein n=1 Tax=Glaciecola petra TaxID=3075602 RepID=A0ABU2ZSP1_9ALTE|nr:type II secretion system F family protein [Aestuariibacter sp. P117]MDT0595652.1 type II secretion system F family protein [Aestuariibacter sp. P117]
MPGFSYKGRLSNGDITQGSVDASDENTVAKMLSARAIIPIEILPNERLEQSTEKTTQAINFLTPNVSLDELVIFSRQMYSLTKAGIPIIRAVSGLTTTKSVRLKVALEDIIASLEKGRNFSSALAQHPDIFNQLFVSVVHVGENTGRLDAAFLQLAKYLEREQETRKQIKAATRYPTFVIIAITAAIVILNIFVIPIFANMFDKFGTELPLMTRILLATSNFFINQWYVLVGLILVSVFITKQYINTQDGLIKWDHLKIRFPVIGPIIERSLLARFSRSFSMMLKSGVPLTTALSLVADAVSNAYMAESILKMRRQIEKGESLTRVSVASSLFTPLVLQMISVGEETGRVDELLEEVSDFYEREVDYDLASLTSKIEPILISVVAVLVLILALGIFTPMWDMMGAVS